MFRTNVDSVSFRVFIFSTWYVMSCHDTKDNAEFYSLRSKRFQSSYCAKVRAEAKKKVEGGGGGEKRKRLPANPTILENAPWNFTVRFICKLTARQNRNITNRLPLDYLPLPRHSFFFCSCQSFLDEPREETLVTQAIKSRIVFRVVTRQYVSRTKNKNSTRKLTESTFVLNISPII